MTSLADRLRTRIAATGPIGVDAYMRAALAEPTGGYYRGEAAIGAAGDFVTAPEISQVFGELIGAWLAATWRAQGAPGAFALVELGPGNGTLMADALRAAAGEPGFIESMRLHLVDIDPGFAARQRDRLSAHVPACHAAFDAVPEGPVFLVANEFFDALPVRQLVRLDDGFHERLVTCDATYGGFRFIAAAAPTPLDAAAAPGEIVEVSPESRALAASVATRIAGFGGAALIVDYGPARSGPGETLQAVQDHRPVDPLAEPGAADLTAHVDFAALAGAASAAGAAVWGPVPQGRFLLALGLEQRLARLLGGADDDQAFLLRSGCRRLIDPAQMGSLFKVLAVTPGGAPPPPGFPPSEEATRC